MKKRGEGVGLSSLLKRFLVEKLVAVLIPCGSLVLLRVIQDPRKSFCLQCLTWKLFVKAGDNIIKLIVTPDLHKQSKCSSPQFMLKCQVQKGHIHNCPLLYLRHLVGLVLLEHT